MKQESRLSNQNNPERLQYKNIQKFTKPDNFLKNYLVGKRLAKIKETPELNFIKSQLDIINNLEQKDPYLTPELSVPRIFLYAQEELSKNTSLAFLEAKGKAYLKESEHLKSKRLKEIIKPGQNERLEVLSNFLHEEGLSFELETKKSENNPLNFIKEKSRAYLNKAKHLESIIKPGQNENLIDLNKFVYFQRILFNLEVEQALQKSSNGK